MQGSGDPWSRGSCGGVDQAIHGLGMGPWSRGRVVQVVSGVKVKSGGSWSAASLLNRITHTSEKKTFPRNYVLHR